MEEKEIYEWNSRFDEAIKDNQIGDIVNAVEVLNKQDKQIKELKKENQQLKQQLHDLPKKIVKEIRYDMSKRIMEQQIKCGDNTQIGFICNAINECLDTILKKYGGEDEINND